MKPLDFEPVESMTYCDKSKAKARIAGLPYPMFFLVFTEFFFVGLPFGIFTWIALIGMQFYLTRLLKKHKVTWTKVFFFYREKKTSTRRALCMKRKLSLELDLRNREK